MSHEANDDELTTETARPAGRHLIQSVQKNDAQGCPAVVIWDAAPIPLVLDLRAARRCQKFKQVRQGVFCPMLNVVAVHRLREVFCLASVGGDALVLIGTDYGFR